jgi:L-lactate dehydrogenase (cytochrome)
MLDKTAEPAPEQSPAQVGTSSDAGVAGLGPDAQLHRRYPTIPFLREGARRNLPRFAFEYMDGGAGEDTGIDRNWAALDAVELIPRYGISTILPGTECELLGRRYAAPVGVAPMGSPSLGWPGADEYLARAAQKARVPYVLGTVGGMTLERAVEVAPDVLWFQLYRLAKNEHRLGFDLARRAEAVGVHALVLTLDVPVRTTRPREVHSGITTPFRPDLRMLLGILTSPGWLGAMLKNGQPRFASLRTYARAGAGINEIANFVRGEMRGGFTWDEVARYRERWKRPLVVKGVLHPADAERAVALGVDGIVVSNHGGRQIDALPAAIDALPAVAAAAGGRATVMMDSGVRSGVDVIRALALGASAAFAGKAFLWGLGALGERGPGHVIDLLVAEMRATLGQVGVRSLGEVRNVMVRHSGALQF